MGGTGGRGLAVVVVVVGALLIAVPRAAPAYEVEFSGSWATAAPMKAARSSHTATLLNQPACRTGTAPANYPCGHVLVAQGRTAELFDPSEQDPSKAWTATAAMNINRSNHKALLLESGKVLVAGGDRVIVGELGAELYDPVQKTWTKTNPLSSKMRANSITPLLTGEVLVIFGFENAASYAGVDNAVTYDQSVAEIYTPSTDTWRLTKGACTVCEGPATLLDDGRVLVAGAKNGPDHAAAELYDPDAESWAPTGSMTINRAPTSSHRLPDGRVLVTTPAELYDPDNGTWSAASDSRPFEGKVALGEPQTCSGMAPPGLCGMVLAYHPRRPSPVPNGYQAGAELRTFVFDPRNERWLRTADRPMERTGGTVTLLRDGRVLAAGGIGALPEGGVGAHAAADVFTAGEPAPPRFPGTWTAAPEMNVARSDHSATLLSPPGCRNPVTPPGYPCGKVLVAGGGTAALFDPKEPDSAAAWSATADMAVDRWTHKAALLASGQVLVVGGRTGTVPTELGAELYDPIEGKWTKTSPLLGQIDMATHSVTPLQNGEVLVVFSPSAAATDSAGVAEIYAPSTDTWRLTKTKCSSCEGPAILLKDGRVLIASASSAQTEIYSLATDGWSAGPPMNSRGPGRGAVATHRLGDDRVLVTPSAEVASPDINSWVPAADDRTFEGHTSLGQGAACSAATPAPACSQILGSEGLHAAVFDASVGEWRRTADRPSLRAGGTTTLLEDGRVLAAGGSSSGGASATADLFTPGGTAIATIAPNSGPESGGTSVSITGRGLSAVTGVRFGAVAATAYTISSDARMAATSPPGAAGTVDIVLDTSTGPVPAVPEGRFTYTPTVAAALVGLEPDVGSHKGGTGVVVTGTGLRSVTAVKFGSVPAKFVIESDRRLRAASPPGSGTVVVRLESPGGISSAKPFSYFVGSPTWSPTGDLHEAGVGHTATLLDGPACRSVTPAGWCGKVLVAGGTSTSGSQGGSTRSELWDPDTGVWRSCVESDADSACPAPLLTEHRWASATLLRSGKVLLVGGTEDATGARAAELYDPESGKWSFAAGMLTSRDGGHTATLLADGTVLVVGGTAFGSATSLAERYDPVADRWSSAGGASEARRTLVGHTATLLPNGQVLVAGGATAEGAPAHLLSMALETCEAKSPLQVCATIVNETLSPLGLNRSDRTSSVQLYDPTSSSWTSTAPMTAARSGHSANLLPDGTVLVAGGCCAANGGAWSYAERYDPAVDTGEQAWTSIPMPVRRVLHTATNLPDGTILLAGALDLGSGARTAEVFNPTSGAFSRTANMGRGRWAHRDVLLPDGRLLVVGGTASGDPDPGVSSEIYDHRALPPTLTGLDPRVGSAGRLVGIEGRNLFPLSKVFFGKVEARVTFSSDTYATAVAPSHPQGTVSVTVQTPLGRGDQVSFTFGSGAWHATGSLIECLPNEPCGGRAWHTATLLRNGLVLIAGGGDGEGKASRGRRSAQLYDPATGLWTTTGAMNDGRFQHSATLLGDGTVLVIGGLNGSAVRTSETYDPATGRWSRTGPPPATTGWLAHTATLLPSGGVLVTGGGREENDRYGVTSAQTFDPRTGEWKAVESLNEGRANHTATLLPGGKVLVTGGLGPGGIVLRSAEVYDAVDKGDDHGWTLRRPSAVPRYAHTATLLGGAECSPSCGKVLVAGGNPGVGRTSATELYDPQSDTWSATGSLHEPLAGHTATTLSDGGVLVAGSGPSFFNGVPPSTATAEIYDPALGVWTNTASMSLPRGAHSAILFDGEHCVTLCGKVLVVGGMWQDPARVGCEAENRCPLVASSELYTPAPRVDAVSPATGPSRGGTTVTLQGYHLSRSEGVSFGGVPAAGFTVASSNSISAVSPPRAGGLQEVVVIGDDGQTSAHIRPRAASSFRHVGTPGKVASLIASAVSPTKVVLSFPAAADSDGDDPLAADEYVVKQSLGPVGVAGFDAASTLCDEAVCRFSPKEVGEGLELAVNDLEPGTTYHYAVMAMNEFGEVGPVSDDAVATTPGTAHAMSCRATEAAADGVRYPGGRYSMVGLPSGTVVAAQSPLYSWFNLGATGAYAIHDPAQPVEAGRGYWAWFRCDTVVPLSDAGPNEGRLSLGAYRASMVGNPSGAHSSVVRGHDFAARWDPDANGGSGGYQLSGYREPNSMAVGEALWVFSYSDTTVGFAVN